MHVNIEHMNASTLLDEMGTQVHTVRHLADDGVTLSAQPSLA